MKLFFDTETSDRADFNKPATDPCQPFLVSVCAVLTDNDCNEVQSVHLIVKNDGTWKSSPGALGVHGITDEHAAKYGVPILTVLSAFSWLARMAEDAYAFNVEFDSRIIRAAFHRAQKPDPFGKVGTELYIPLRCEMLAMTDHCKLAGGRGGQFKWPSLAEAHQHAMGTGFKKAHDAQADTRALIAVHKWRTQTRHNSASQGELAVGAPPAYNPPR